MHPGRLIWIAVALISWSPVAFATIVDGQVTGGKSLQLGGKFIKLTIPFAGSSPYNTVGADTFNDSNLYGFDEDQNIEIRDPLTLDIMADGKGGGRKGGVVPVGITVASHYIFFDPGKLQKQQGEIQFDSMIIGVITKRNNLKNSDHLANTGVNYLNPGARGLEQVDKVAITGLQTISVNWIASSPGDYIRVITSYSPGAGVLIPSNQR